jgi:hypothetical protein
MRRIRLDEKVVARKVLIPHGEAKVGVPGPPDDEGVVLGECKYPAFVGTIGYGEGELHGRCCLSFGLRSLAIVQE